MTKFDPHLFFNRVSKKNFDPPPSSLNPPPKEKFRPPPTSFWTIRTLFILFKFLHTMVLFFFILASLGDIFYGKMSGFVVTSQWRNQSERATWSTDQQAVGEALSVVGWEGEPLTEIHHRSFFDFRSLFEFVHFGAYDFRNTVITLNSVL